MGGLSPYAAGPGYTIYQGDAAEVLAELPDACVDGIVSSPPYADIIRASGDRPVESYVEWFLPITEQLRRVLRPPGGFMLNLGRVFRDGQDTPFAEQVLVALLEQGWKRIDSIVWVQTNGRPIGPYYLCDCHEHVYWLARSPQAYRGYDQDTRRPHAEETIARYGRRWKERYQKGGTGAVTPDSRTPLHVDGARPDSIYVGTIGREKGNPHPSPMDRGFARHLVCLVCPPGGVVLDPFFGSGNVGREAVDAGRSVIGIELSEEWCEEATNRLGQLSLLAPG